MRGNTRKVYCSPPYVVCRQGYGVFVGADLCYAKLIGLSPSAQLVLPASQFLLLLYLTGNSTGLLADLLICGSPKICIRNIIAQCCPLLHWVSTEGILFVLSAWLARLQPSFSLPPHLSKTKWLLRWHLAPISAPSFVTWDNTTNTVTASTTVHCEHFPHEGSLPTTFDPNPNKDSASKKAQSNSWSYSLQRKLTRLWWALILFSRWLNSSMCLLQFLRPPPRLPSSCL